MSNKNQKFEIGNIYEMRFIGDSELKPQFICTNRTAEFATLERFKNKEDKLRRKIQLDSYGNEYIVTGSYSMAPSINARKVVG